MLIFGDLTCVYPSCILEEGRKLHQENFLNREAAARSALSIIEEQTQSDKYTQLLFALDTAGKLISNFIVGSRET